MSNIWVVAFAVFFLNLPFGLFRAGARRFSAPWFLAVHLPVPLVVCLRYVSGLGWSFTTFPVLISAFFLGQFLGGKFHRPRKRKEPNSVSNSP